MAHKHSVYDSDTHFSIDPVTRAISNEGSSKNVLIVRDHNSERFTFELPRYTVDGHDMSLCNCVEVHYINADKMSPEKNRGVYACTDFGISPDSEDVVICSWLISREATKYVGLLSFALRFACLSDDGVEEYQWSTAIHQGFAISDGIHNTEYVAEEYADILAQWRAEIDAIIAEGGGGSGHTHDNKKTLDGFYCEVSEYVPPEGDFPIGGGAVKSDRLTFGEHEIRYVGDGDVIKSVETTDSEITITLAPYITSAGVTIDKPPIIIPIVDTEAIYNKIAEVEGGFDEIEAMIDESGVLDE